MPQKLPQLPRLPGFDFNFNIGRTKFNKSQLFGKIHDNVYFEVKSKTSQHSRYPAIYAWGEEAPSPPWIALDGQRLMFKAYFQESIHEGREAYSVRLVNISFFLEDGTIKISEPFIDNSGLEQGVLVKRQRIPLPDPVKYRYYDILDLNIDKEPEIYGRVYKIYDCDKFTRKFLNRMGIPVPDPFEPPTDPRRERKKQATVVKVCHQKRESIVNFFKYDRQILRFYGYWDDSDSPYGYVHDLEILYYLADDTIEIFEFMPASCGSSAKSVLVKRIKIPKIFKEIEPLGSHDPITLLNVLGENINKSYYVPDNSYCQKSTNKYYKECDITIGAHLNVFNREIVITDVDKFTREFYRKKYGLDDFTPLERPDTSGHDNKHLRFIPPYNGFGSYEDSLANCFSVVPKRPKHFVDKFFNYENQDIDNRILRFGARMISNNPDNADRFFIISVFLLDKRVSVYEIGMTNSGFVKSLFRKKLPIRLPGQELLSNQPPKYYEPQDFYIGTRVNLEGFEFKLISADEYTFNYMNTHCNEFPKADVKLIMSKIRENLKPVYREFINKYSPHKTEKCIPPTLRLSCLREAMYQYLDDEITEHEIITIARHYSICEQMDPCPRDCIRSLVHTELIRNGWNELERLEEEIRAWDRNRTGYLPRNQVYMILRACRVPLERELISLMLDRIDKNTKSEIDCHDLLKFLNIKVNPLPPMIPTNYKELYWTKQLEQKDCEDINWCSFLKDLGLEDELTEPTKEKESK